MTAPTVPVTSMRTVHVDVNGHRETFLVGHVGTDGLGWLFVRTTHLPAMTAKAWASDAAPLPIQIEWLFDITDHAMTVEIARVITEAMGVQAPTAEGRSFTAKFDGASMLEEDDTRLPEGEFRLSLYTTAPADTFTWALGQTVKIAGVQG